MFRAADFIGADELGGIFDDLFSAFKPVFYIYGLELSAAFSGDRDDRRAL